MAQIGFLGMGNMGYAMLQGLLSTIDKVDIIFSDINKERVKQVYEETGVRFVDSNAECSNKAKYIILAVKPQFYQVVIKNIKDIVTPEHIIISIAPGITIEQLQQWLGRDKRIVRAMPNTPALVKEGMTTICYEEDLFSQQELIMIQSIFTSFGKVKKISEHLMSAAVCASGSSPAYMYMFIEALADSVVKYGMPRKDAYDLIAQTMVGVGKMVQETNVHPGELKDMVCSPAGTTIEGVLALEEHGFRGAISKATKRCYEKSEAMK